MESGGAGVGDGQAWCREGVWKIGMKSTRIALSVVQERRELGVCIWSLSLGAYNSRWIFVDLCHLKVLI